MANTGVSLASFSTELIQAILSSASDAFALRSLAQSCSAFHQAFLGAESLILRNVLRNEFDADVLPDALASLAAVRLPLKEKGEREEFLASFNYSDWSIPESWSIKESIALSKIRIGVQFFASRYALTLTGNPVTGVADEKPIRLAASEMNRIERALYRYELYCNLFCNEDNISPRPEVHDRNMMFFDKFAPWENEQFRSVYRFLQLQFSVVFDDIASHEVEWGKRGILCDTNWTDTYQEHYLSLGIGFIHRAVDAGTYEERFESLRHDFGCEVDDDFLGDLYFVDAFIGEKIDELTEAERKTRFKPPFFPDPDPGPAEAWLFAYRTSTGPNEIYCATDLIDLTDRGYVFFDYSRLCNWEMFSRQYKVDLIHGAAEYEDEVASFEKIEESRKAREKIWDLGGRGWWSQGDESKLVWPYKKENEGIKASDDPRFNGLQNFDEYVSKQKIPMLRRSWGPYGEYKEDSKC